MRENYGHRGHGKLGPYNTWLNEIGLSLLLALQEYINSLPNPYGFRRSC